MARIVTVYMGDRLAFRPVDMSYVRWLKISEALARRGHRVDLATNEPGLRSRLPRRLGPRLRRVPLSRVRFDRYDVVKTLFHIGFRTLEAQGGAGHPCIISKLGSVVGAEDRPGVYFHGEQRKALFATQERIAARSRIVSILTEPSRALWRECFDERPETLLVPGAADETLPPLGPDPFGPERRVRCLFAGNLYQPDYQPRAHALLVEKVNELGRRLSTLGVRLHLLGPGDTTRVDPGHVTCAGAVPYDRSWDWLRHADVGIVLALGPEPNHNESTKIYHYLRAGLPTVCEAGFPNEGLLAEASLGEVVRNGAMEEMATAIAATAERTWDRQRAMDFVLREHTWDRRAERYEALFARLGVPGATSRS